jgi:serine/threonine protein kinase
MQFCPSCRAAYRSQLSFCPRDGVALIPGPDPLIGQIIANRYRVISRLGKGGMGQVYLVEHVEIGKRFALKVLFGDLASNDKMLARFKREAQAASLLKHIHIISVTDFGSTEHGLAFLAMELLSGNSLAHIIEKEGPLSINRTFHIGKQIANALAHAHDKGILHRDLKPENVMVEDREEGSDFITVLDFGLARILQSKSNLPNEQLTMIGTVQGTPEYMSPEQAQGFTLGPPSDLYALGLLLYCMLSREIPFPLPPKRSDMLALHAFEPPRPLSKLVKVPPPVEAIVMRLLEKDPAKRFASGRDVAFAIEDALAANEKRRRNAAADTWDEDSTQTLSDNNAVTVSELDSMEEIDGAQTIRMSVSLPSVLELEQTATPSLSEEGDGYVVIPNQSAPQAALSDVEQTAKTLAQPVHIPPKPKSEPRLLPEPRPKPEPLPALESKSGPIGVPPESLGATFKIPAVKEEDLPLTNQDKTNSIAWFLAGLFLVSAVLLAILFWAR